MSECKYCKKLFIPTRKNRLYCSIECSKNSRLLLKRKYERDWRKNHLQLARDRAKLLYHTRYKDKEKLWREANKEKLKFAHKEYAQNLRREVIFILGGQCANPYNLNHGDFLSDWRCLQVDHVHGGGYREIRKFKGPNQYYRHLLKEIKAGSKEYQCLCSNCNWIKKYKNGEYRKNH